MGNQGNREQEQLHGSPRTVILSGVALSPSTSTRTRIRVPIPRALPAVLATDRLMAALSPSAGCPGSAVVVPRKRPFGTTISVAAMTPTASTSQATAKGKCVPH